MCRGVSALLFHTAFAALAVYQRSLQTASRQPQTFIGCSVTLEFQCHSIKWIILCSLLLFFLFVDCDLFWLYHCVLRCFFPIVSLCTKAPWANPISFISIAHIFIVDNQLFRPSNLESGSFFKMCLIKAHKSHLTAFTKKTRSVWFFFMTIPTQVQIQFTYIRNEPTRLYSATYKNKSSQPEPCTSLF